MRRSRVYHYIAYTRAGALAEGRLQAASLDDGRCPAADIHPDHPRLVIDGTSAVRDGDAYGIGDMGDKLKGLGAPLMFHLKLPEVFLES